MREHAVDERGFDGSALKAGANNSGGLFAGVSACEFQSDHAGRKISARDHGCERIEDVLLRLLRYFFRELVCRRLTHVSAETRGYRTDRRGFGRAQCARSESTCSEGKQASGFD